MRAQEAEELMDEVWHAICKKGLPINVRTGQNMDAADWVKEILKKQISIDEPIGVVQGDRLRSLPEMQCGGRTERILL